MPDVSVSTLRANEYNGRKVVLRDTHGTQMSIPRFFQLALVSSTGIGVNPTQGYSGGHESWDMASNGYEGIVPARCPVFGTVYFTQQNHEMAGNWVVVQENTGGQFDRWHIFMHLYNIAVSEGDIISQGTSVGMIGNTGSSTGPHLHYQIATANPLETYRTSEDPMVTFDRGSLNPAWTMEDAVSAHNWDYIQLDDAATDYGPPGGGGGVKAVNIKLRINPPPEIIFKLRYPLTSDTYSLENTKPVVPGYFKPADLYKVQNAHLRTETYQMSDTLKTDILLAWDYSLQLSRKPVMLFTTDGRDPLLYGRTVYLKQEGEFEVNDIERSTNVFPLLTEYAFPLNIRAVLIDADNHSLILTQASAVFTRESVLSTEEQHERIAAYCNELVNDSDAENNDINTEDMHGYVAVNESYDTTAYYDLF